MSNSSPEIGAVEPYRVIFEREDAAG